MADNKIDMSNTTAGASQSPDTTNASSRKGTASGMDVLDAVALAQKIMVGDRTLLDVFGETTDCFVAGGTHARYGLIMTTATRTASMMPQRTALTLRRTNEVFYRQPV